MGSYIVNGEVVDVQEQQPTARDLKVHIGSVMSDWVMAWMPGGKAVQLSDREVLPVNADSFSIVAPHKYGW